MPTLNSNTLTRQVDLPTWEWTRFAPAISSAIASTCSADNPNFLSTEHGRYIYSLLNSTNFWRYDTFTDVYQQLPQPPVALTTYSSMKLMGGMGPEGVVLANAGSNTLTVPAVSAQAMLGYDVVIVSGTGAGQRRTITGVAEPTVHASGTISAVSNTQGALSLTDAAATATANQWAGYTLRLTSGLGVGQYRRILYNTATVFTLGDTTVQNKPYNNPGIFLVAPAITTGNNAAYSIESQVLTVDSAWGTPPDTTSVFRIQSGMISMVTSTAAAPFFAHQMYDILTDTWYVMPASTNILLAAATDMSLERMSENASIWERGTATGGATTHIHDTSLGVDNPAWRVNQWAGYWVYIFSGTGAGNIRQITTNTVDTLNWSGSVSPAPSAGSRYMILGFDAGTSSAAGTQPSGLTLGTLTDGSKAWAENRWKNYAVRILAGTGAGQVRTIASNTATVLSIYGRWDTLPSTDSIYVIQGDPDKMFMWKGGNAALPIMNLESTVTTLGRQTDWGIARSSAATVAGHQPVSIASATWVANVVTITTTHAHQFRVGNSVTVAGMTTSPAVNGTYTIASVTSPTTFTYSLTGSGTVGIGTAQSVTLLVDVTKAWQTNEHAGRYLYVQTVATTGTTGAATTLVGRITANDATTLTIVASGIGTAPTNGVSRYSICTASGPGTLHAGLASTGSAVAITQTGAGWTTNAYSGKRVRIFTTGTTPIEVTITSNNTDTLTVPTITSPTANITGFQILEGVAKGPGCNANWAFGTTNADIRGRYMFATRGGGLAGFDRLDVTTDRMSPIATSPTTEVLTTGTMTAYDGGDRIYFHVNGTQRVMSLNVVTAHVDGGSMYPYVAPTAIIGNRMEIISNKDGLKYLWLNRASFSECFRCLLYW